LRPAGTPVRALTSAYGTHTEPQLRAGGRDQLVHGLLPRAAADLDPLDDAGIVAEVDPLLVAEPPKDAGQRERADVVAGRDVAVSQGGDADLLGQMPRCQNLGAFSDISPMIRSDPRPPDSIRHALSSCAVTCGTAMARGPSRCAWSAIC
jgi:hypothetical protein